MDRNIVKFRPIPFYFINTRNGLDRSAIFIAMEKLREAGFGGCIVFNKPSDGFSNEDYLGDEWFEMIGHFAESGRELDLQIWLNDGFDYPPGDVGGRIEKIDPSLKQRMLQERPDGSVGVVELDWGFPAFEEPESSRLFIKFVYEEHYKRLGQYFGSGITGFFSDADCRRINSFVISKLNGSKYFPWSQNFAVEFLKEYDYEIEPHLSDIVRESGSKACRDYWRLAGMLYTRWFRNNYEWCRAHGLLYSFHTSDTGPFMREDCARSSIFAEGAFLHQAKFCDYPGTDHELLALDGGTHFDKRYYVPSASWGGGGERIRTPDFNVTKWDLRAKYASSAAYLYGRQRVLCEAFAATNWGASHQDLRRIATWQIMQGINFFVPHAVHHRLCGETRYFAPPEFCSGSLRHGLRKFNDWLTEMCFLVSQGTLVEPLAIFDPTEAVLIGAATGHELFEICDRLNRMPINYVIVDEMSLREKPGRFKLLLLPGVSLEWDMHELLVANGCTILNINEIDRLPIPDIKFDGGELHYMRRQLSNGDEMLLIANVWSDITVKGTLCYNGRSYCLQLDPGEIAVVGGPYQSFRQPHKSVELIELPYEMPVCWESDNVLLLPYCNSFRWNNLTELPSPRLLVPDAGMELYLDGQPIGESSPTRFFDQPYWEINLPAGGAVGPHTLELRPTTNAPWNALYLTGDFDVNLSIEGEFSHKYCDYYSMSLYLPACCEATLSPRSGKLHVGSWAEQGAPFYSGAVTYLAEFEHRGGHVALVLSEVHDVCTVKCDGIEIGHCIWSPYEFDLELLQGRHRLEIMVRNSLANLLEGYRAPSGIVRTKK